MDILSRIIAHKKEEVHESKAVGTNRGPMEGAPTRGFRDHLVANNDLSIIAEVKKASPSKGVIQPDFDPVDIATAYEERGAAAVSVLTDRRFFQGSLEYLPRIKEAVSLPLLRKDFIIDHHQIDEARAWGADAILLIAAVLDRTQINEFFLHARELGLDCLTEVHNEDEAEKAINAEVDLLGVNNRNLVDFSVDISTTFRIRGMTPQELPLVSESGITSTEEISLLKENGITAALVGESVMRQPTLLADLVAAGKGE